MNKDPAVEQRADRGSAQESRSAAYRHDHLMPSRLRREEIARSQADGGSVGDMLELGEPVFHDSAFMKRPVGFAALLSISVAACGDSGSIASGKLFAAGNVEPRKDRVGKHNPPGPSIELDLRLLVDQFGYRPGDRKVAVIRTPVAGYDAGSPFNPADRLEVRRVKDGSAAFEGPITPWNNGVHQESSGDAGWWFDFSTLDETGEYYLYDGKNRVRSAVFRIDSDVFRAPLRAATKMYYYQRSGVDKKGPHADACWTDAAAYVGPRQDLEARDIRARDNPATARDVSGGWFDAGDTNKYVTFAAHAVHQLLTAYQRYPRVFSDDFGIPESGNGIPDLVDEVKWEIDWLKKMQNPDGTSALKVGVIDYKRVGVPSADRLPRYYIGSCTSSTITAAGMFAHAADVYRTIPQLSGEAQELSRRARLAFDAFLASKMLEEDCDDQTIRAGDADLDRDAQLGFAAQAALYLFAATGEARYHDYLKRNYKAMWPYRDIGWSRYYPSMGDALLHYTTLPNADPEFKANLLRDKEADAMAGSGVYRESPEDLYRSHMPRAQYHWGSNSVRAAYGSTNMDVVAFRLDQERHASYEARAVASLNYLHGVNPFGQVYLSNMYRHGVTHSLNEIFHAWFWEGTRYANALTSECGPAPGYLVGGPNAKVADHGVPADLVPPSGQPAQKAYLDRNLERGAAWTFAEPSIVYQAAYIKLLAAVHATQPTAAVRGGP